MPTTTTNTTMATRIGASPHFLDRCMRNLRSRTVGCTPLSRDAFTQEVVLKTWIYLPDAHLHERSKTLLSCSWKKKSHWGCIGACRGASAFVT